MERYCAGLRLDLFACEHRTGWIPNGDEVGKYDPPEDVSAAIDRVDAA
jgi:hypothetical protein